VGMREKFAELGFRGDEATVFFAVRGLGDFFTKGARVLAIERLADCRAQRIRPREVAKHLGPSHALQNRQMPPGGQKQGQSDHYGRHGSKYGKPLEHLKRV